MSEYGCEVHGCLRCKIYSKHIDLINLSTLEFGFTFKRFDTGRIGVAILV